jgi:hypothetical protein
MGTASKPTKSTKVQSLSRLLTRVSTWFTFNVFALVSIIGSHFALGLASIKWWPDVFAISINLLTGGLVSFLFYYLVIYLPDLRKKSIIKKNLQEIYKSIKMEMLRAIVEASKKGGRTDLETSFEFVESLISPVEFKKAFKSGREHNEGFYAFQNQMSQETPEFHQIVCCLKMLAKQVEFVLHNYTIDDPLIFAFFKQLELLLMGLQSNGAGYDESKPLCSFIWEIYAGRNFINGYTGHDPIQKMISDL